MPVARHSSGGRGGNWEWSINMSKLPINIRERVDSERRWTRCDQNGIVWQALRLDGLRFPRLTLSLQTTLCGKFRVAP